LPEIKVYGLFTLRLVLDVYVMDAQLIINRPSIFPMQRKCADIIEFSIQRRMIIRMTHVVNILVAGFYRKQTLIEVYD